MNCECWDLVGGLLRLRDFKGQALAVVHSCDPLYLCYLSSKRNSLRFTALMLCLIRSPAVESDNHRQTL